MGFGATTEPAIVSGWRAGAHAQIWISEWLNARGRFTPAWRVRELSLGRGGSARALMLEPPITPRGALIVLHGLGGSADGPNVRRLAIPAAAAGWRVVAIELRGAGGTIQQPRLYTAGDVDELDAIVADPMVAECAGPRLGVGLSLGGGMLVRWLGLRGHAARLDGVIGVCPTVHLPSAARALALFWHRIYDWNFALALGRRVRAVAPNYGRRAHGWWRHRTLFRLDDDFASKVEGCAGAEAYYESMSAHHHLDGVRRPVLLIATADDPFVPAATLRTHVSGQPQIELRMSPRGSHLAFIESTPTGLAQAWPRLVIEAADGFRR